MDKPSANRSAMLKIEEKYPGQVIAVFLEVQLHPNPATRVFAPCFLWLAMGCMAHALNLFIKDYCNEEKASGVAAVMSQAQNLSMVIGDSPTIRGALHEVQTKKYGKIKAISAQRAGASLS
eukprot:scaffold95212_cov14-Tisochrysis_lutea.AAC.2